MESAKYTTIEAMQTILELEFGEDTCNINGCVQKRMQNNVSCKIINIEKTNMSPAVYFSILVRKLPLQKEVFPCCENCPEQKLYGRKCKTLL